MTIYARLYIDTVQQTPDLELSGRTFTVLNTAQTRVSVGSGTGARIVNINQDWYHIDSGLVYPATSMSKNILNEPWDNLTAWTETNTGDGDSTIDPAGQLKQSASTRPSLSQLDKTIADTGTQYTIEIKSIVNTMQAATSYYANWNLIGHGDLGIIWAYDTDIETDPYVMLYTGVGWQKYYYGITAWHKFRILISTSLIPPTPSVGVESGGWFIF